MDHDDPGMMCALFHGFVLCMSFKIFWALLPQMDLIYLSPSSLTTKIIGVILYPSFSYFVIPIHFKKVNNTSIMKSTEVQNPRRIRVCGIRYAQSEHCEITRAVRVTEKYTEIASRTEPERYPACPVLSRDLGGVQPSVSLAQTIKRLAHRKRPLYERQTRSR